MTWATLVVSQPPLRIELLGSFAMRVLFYWIPALIFTAFDRVMPTLSSDLKVRRGGDIRSRDIFWIGMNGLLNQLFATAIQGGIQFTYSQLLMRKTSVFHIGITPPLPLSIIKDILLILTIREVITYVVHRYILHNSRRFSQLSRFHNMHHQFAKYPVFALKGQYYHYIDYFLIQFCPLYLPAYLLRVHLLTFFLTLAFVSLESALTYSGYDIFWRPLGGAVRRIDRHHRPGGDRMDFGIWGILDWCCGTSGGDSRSEKGGAMNVNRGVSKEFNRQRWRSKK